MRRRRDGRGGKFLRRVGTTLVAAMIMLLQPPSCQLDFGDLDSCIANHLPDFRFGKISSCARAHFGKAIPFIDTELAYSDFDVQSAIILRWNSSLA
jgi:hypothetical protein